MSTRFMEIYLSQTRNKPIVALDTPGKIGEVGDAVIDPSTGKLVAVCMIDGWSAKRVIAAIDIRELSQRLLIINSINDIEKPEEIVNIGRIQTSGIRIIGNRVRTQSGRHLGRVTDAAIDTSAMLLSKIVVKTRWFDRVPKKLLIAHDQILKIEKDAITVKDEIVKEGETKAVTAPAAP